MSARRPSLGSLLNSLSGGRLHWLNDPIDPQPRYGHGKPVHPQLHELFDRGRAACRERLEKAVQHRDLLAKLPLEPSSDPFEPWWNNGMFPGLDVVTLYAVLADEQPQRYVEIGSGHSTRFAWRAAKDLGLSLHITSIDPQPRIDVDHVCDEVVRRRLEDTDLAPFDALEPGDVVFMDSSHQAFMNSDVVVFFLEVLPRLRPGVLIHLHDIWLPSDYPARWRHWLFGEQYLLATTLLSAPESFEVLFPNRFITDDAELSAAVAPVWDDPRLASVARHGGSFWMRKTDGARPAQSP